MELYIKLMSWKLCQNGSVSPSGVSFLYNADAMTSALFRTSKKFKLSFLLPASILTKYSNLRTHRCSISIVFSQFLGRACMLLCNNVLLLPVFSYWVTQIIAQNFWRCVQTQRVQITLWCLNFNTVDKGEIQCPPPHFTLCSECTRRPCFGPCFRKLSPPAPSPG